MNIFCAVSRQAGSAIAVPVLLFAFVTSASAAAALPAIQQLRGANQETTYGAAFPAPLVVWVTDPVTERAMSGVTVHYVAGAGIGLSSTNAVTDEYGLASVTATGLTVCTSQVRAEVAGSPDANVTFEGLVVDKAVLTVVPADLEMRLGSTLPALAGYSFQGFVNGDTVETAQITGAPVLTTTAKDRSPHANYAIKGGMGTLFSPNYTFVPGFGTIAVLNEPNPGGYADAPEAYILPPAKEDDAHVQTAIVDEPVTIAIKQPSFLAGLRGESGAFVRAAIWQSSTATSAEMASYLIRTAIGDQPVAAITVQPTFVAGLRETPETAVLAAVLPAAMIAAPAMQSLQARAAIPVVPAGAASSSDAPVRKTVSPVLSTVSVSTPAAHTQSVIRKAYNPQPVYR